MSKKRVIWVIGIIIIITIVLVIANPYIFKSNNLISKNKYDYEYVQLETLDLEGGLDWLDDTDVGPIDKLVHIIDDLSVKKAIKSSNKFKYSITFIATYEEDKKIQYTKPVFTLNFYDNNVIGFKKEPGYREQYYKVQNKEFNIKEVMEQLQKR